MDAEGLGRKLLLTPSGDPRRAPERQTLSAVTSSHKMRYPASTFELSQCLRCKEGLPGPRRGFWVPSGSLPLQTGRVHLHIIDLINSHRIL